MKTLRETEKMLVTSIFSFSHNVFYSVSVQTSSFELHLFCCLQMLSVWSEILLSDIELTHNQMTNFRLFQTERVCRQQFQIGRKWKKVIQTGRKHWEKEELLIMGSFSFSHSVFKRLVSQGRQKVSLCGNGIHKGL